MQRAMGEAAATREALESHLSVAQVRAGAGTA